MGAWAEYTFGNDAACDWLGSFMHAPRLQTVEKAIQAVISERKYLTANVACNCLAACEVVARLQGHWGVRNSYSEALDQWVIANPIIVPNRLIELGKAAIDRILAGNSELKELWDEGGQDEVWHEAVDDLRFRLQEPPADKLRIP